MDSKKNWRWSDGSTWKYTNWFPGEPNDDHRSQDRVTINYVWNKNSDWIGKWDDQKSTYKTSSICQLKPVSKGKTTKNFSFIYYFYFRNSDTFK